MQFGYPFANREAQPEAAVRLRGLGSALIEGSNKVGNADGSIPRPLSWTDTRMQSPMS
jgi:hypothetical protein